MMAEYQPTKAEQDFIDRTEAKEAELAKQKNRKLVSYALRKRMSAEAGFDLDEE